MVFARGTDDSPTGAGTVEINNSGHLRLRHNLEAPETVITPRLSDGRNDDAPGHHRRVHARRSFAAHSRPSARSQSARDSPVTISMSHRLTSGDAGCSRLPVALATPASSATATPSESATSPRPG